MIAVFDLDDTISVHKNRDYPNAIPIIPVIEKMRVLRDAGWEIVIYTARGQVSCKGDIRLIEERNRKVIEAWLERYDVPYDKLIFGKPLGDLYVDDKGISLKDFLQQPIEVLHGGGSGKNIYRIGDNVKKEFSDENETQAFKTWNETNRVFRTPKVTSYLYNSVYMEYVDGINASYVDAKFLNTLLHLCTECKNIRAKFDISVHINRMIENRADDWYYHSREYNDLIDEISSFLNSNKERLSKEGSFCHGDMILSNIILKGEEPYFVDARYTPDGNSYLLDLAKLRMSLSGYELIFHISETDNTKHVAELDEYCERLGVLDLVIALEIMFIIRCYRYKNNEDKQKIVIFALAEAMKWRRE